MSKEHSVTIDTFVASQCNCNGKLFDDNGQHGLSSSATL